MYIYILRYVYVHVRRISSNLKRPQKQQQHHRILNSLGNLHLT